MLMFEHLQHLRQQVHDHTGRGAQAHAPGLTAGVALHGVDGLVGVAQQAPGTIDQRGAGGRGRDAPAAAHDQRRSEPRFQLADVQANRRLSQVQRPRRGGERAQVGDRHQGAQLVEVELTHQEI